MSFIDHISRCNTHDIAGYKPLLVENRVVGHIRRRNTALLEGFADVFTLDADRISLAEGLDSYEDRTNAVGRVLRSLADDGIIPGWRDEAYPVGGRWGGPYAFEIERAAAAFLGCRAYGVHINGFVRDGEDVKLWVATRAHDRPVCPGQLDNMIAGGQPVGLTLKENVIKEAGEEAGVPAALARNAKPVGAITYTMENDLGLKPDMMFCWDLELPVDFQPVNTDGEVAEFRLLPAAEVLDIVETTEEFKFNCNLVIIDFCIRHGVLPPEHPDYEAILKGLRS